jgi:hypothetical protein
MEMLCLLFSFLILLIAYRYMTKPRHTQYQYSEIELGEMWSELADRTGLTYEPGYEDVDNSFRGPLGDPMRVWGDYRGRYIYMGRAAHSAGDDYPSVVNTIIRLDVQNSALFSLDIHQKGWLRKLTGSGKLSGWGEDLDQRLSIAGQPQEFLQSASELIGSADPSLKTWMIDYHPPIRLAQSHLTCELGKLTDIDIQSALLDLLCDLAELAEKMGSL